MILKGVLTQPRPGRKFRPEAPTCIRNIQMGKREKKSLEVGLISEMPTPVQGQLLGAGRPANRARIQLICSLTESPMTALAFRPGYSTKSTRSFCLHSRATTVAVRADGASGSASPLINSNGPWTGFRPGVFRVKNSLTYRLFSQPGFNISLAARSGP